MFITVFALARAFWFAAYMHMHRANAQAYIEPGRESYGSLNFNDTTSSYLAAYYGYDTR